jgi:hypothetical protein
MFTFTLRMLNQLMLGFARPSTVTRARGIPSTDVAFRCWPIDLDIYMHMNNSCYLRVAELARWRAFPATGLLGKVMRDKVLFLAVEQQIRYLRPIAPFRKYVVSTTCTVHEDDKWLWYRHVFEQHPDDVKPGKEAGKYAIIDLKAVLKEQSGKTIQPSSQRAFSPFSEELFVKSEQSKTRPFEHELP